MRSSHWRWRMVHPTYEWVDGLQQAARAYFRKYGRLGFRHTHAALLRWPAPVEMCVCGAFRDGLRRVDIHDEQWVVPGAAQHVIMQAEAGSRLAQRALAEQFQYAR